MGKYIAATLLTAFLSSTTFAGSEGPHSDGVIASFDRMLNHQPTVLAHSSAPERDALQEAFAAALWGGAQAGTHEPVAGALAYPRPDERPAGLMLNEIVSKPEQVRK